MKPIFMFFEPYDVKVAYLPEELCKPACLQAAAAAADALFVRCPHKYGCKQFLNPNKKGGTE